MRNASRSLIAAAVLWGAASASFGLGFGRTTANTVLGQPLDFVVMLRQDADEFVDAECVEAEVVAGDEKLPKQQVRVAFEGPANAAERVLRVTSSVGIAEPVVSITLGVGCPVRLSRNFVAFIDPPSIQLAQQGDAPSPSALPATSVAVPESPASTAPAAEPAAASLPPAPRAATAQPRRAARRAAPASAPGQAATTIAAAPSDAKPAAVQRPRAAVTQRARTAKPPAEGSRLVLDAPPAPTPARIAADEADKAAAAAATATLAANAAAEAASQAAASEAQRSRALEQALAQLKAQAQKTSDDYAALRRRVQQAEADRYANPMTYGLGALAAVLALLLLALLWKRQREQDARWWSDAAAARADAGEPSRRDPDSVVADSRLGASLPVVIEPVPPSTPVRALNAAALVAPETRPAVAEPRRAVSVEELIDLEQQAEFFAVLGQHDQAIDLLMNHLRGTGGISPLPYLKLLEIYRRRGDREPYERMRERFNRRFNAYAPEWDADMSASRALDSYPQVMQRIEAAWPSPQQAMDELEALLFRRDEGETFDVPAYSELLFLYALARDRSGQPEEAGAAPVDIELPLDRVPPPMVSTISLDAKPEAERPLTLDLELHDEPESAITASASSRERAERYEGGDFSFRSDAGDKLKRR